MAAGTLVSRILGFVKTILLTVAIGSLSTVGDVFETANTLPNLIYVLVAGGVFNAVLVPQIIKAAKAQDGGARYISKLVTLTVTAIGLITLITVACAWPIISIMGSGWSPEQRQLGFIFALWCLPQIFFYGLYAVIGQVLNAKDAFGAYMWSPVLNNVITILSLFLFIFLFGAIGLVLSSRRPLSDAIDRPGHRARKGGSAADEDDSAEDNSAEDGSAEPDSPEEAAPAEPVAAESASPDQEDS